MKFEEVVQGIGTLKRELPVSVQELGTALNMFLIQGMSPTHDSGAFARAQSKLLDAYGQVQETMKRLGLAAKSVLEEGDLSSKERDVCEVLCQVFVPERGLSG